MPIMVLRLTISIGFRGAILTKDIDGRDLSAKANLDKVEENFRGSLKTYANTLIMKMLTSPYNGQGGIRKYIMNMCNMANQLKDMDI